MIRQDGGTGEDLTVQNKFPGGARRAALGEFYIDGLKAKVISFPSLHNHRLLSFYISIILIL